MKKTSAARVPHQIPLEPWFDFAGEGHRVHEEKMSDIMLGYGSLIAIVFHNLPSLFIYRNQFIVPNIFGRDRPHEKQYMDIMLFVCW